MRMKSRRFFLKAIIGAPAVAAAVAPAAVAAPSPLPVSSVPLMGMGDLMPMRFTVPLNPLRYRPDGLIRAYGSKF